VDVEDVRANLRLFDLNESSLLYYNAAHVNRFTDLDGFRAVDAASLVLFSHTGRNEPYIQAMDVVHDELHNPILNENIFMQIYGRRLA
jgi:hypothetical protein